jgi:hypothetical protein
LFALLTTCHPPHRGDYPGLDWSKKTWKTVLRQGGALLILVFLSLIWGADKGFAFGIIISQKPSFSHDAIFIGVPNGAHSTYSYQALRICGIFEEFMITVLDNGSRTKNVALARSEANRLDGDRIPVANGEPCGIAAANQLTAEFFDYTGIDSNVDNMDIDGLQRLFLPRKYNGANNYARAMRRNKIVPASLPEAVSGPPQASGENDKNQGKEGKREFSNFRVAQKLVPPIAFVPLCIFCIIGALYFIRLGYSQLESGRWFGLCALWGGTLLSGFGAFGMIIGPITMRAGLELYERLMQ